MAEYDKLSEEMLYNISELKRLITGLLSKFVGGKNKWTNSQSTRLIKAMIEFVMLADDETDTLDSCSRAIYDKAFIPFVNFYSESNDGNRRGKENSLRITEAETVFFASLSFSMYFMQEEEVDTNKEDAPIVIEKLWSGFSEKFNKAVEFSKLIICDMREEYFSKTFNDLQDRTRLDNIRNSEKAFYEMNDAFSDKLEGELSTAIDLFYIDFMPIVKIAFEKQYSIDIRYNHMELKLRTLLKQIKKLDILYKSILLSELEMPLNNIQSKLENVKNEEDLIEQFVLCKDFPDVDIAELEELAKYRVKRKNENPDET